MKIAPIPKRLLVHSVTYEEHAGRDKWSNDTYAPPVTIDFVRVEEMTILERNNLDNKHVYNSVIFVDSVHSTHNDIQFKERSKITFNGKPMILRTALMLSQPFSPGLHHWELEVV